MKNFFREVFKVTLFDVMLLAVCSGFKILIVKTGLADKIHPSYILIGLGLLFVFVVAVGVGGIIENKWGSMNRWKELRSSSTLNIFSEGFITWGQFIPIVCGLILFAYIIAPDSLSFFLIMVAVIFVRNLLTYYFGRKSRSHKEEAEVDVTDR